LFTKPYLAPSFYAVQNKRFVCRWLVHSMHAKIRRMTPQDYQIPMESVLDDYHSALPALNGDRVRVNPNAVEQDDKPFHDWYRFVLSYPPHLVRDYAKRFGLEPRATVLDPFCGTGTTVVEAKRIGLHGIGLEANPFSHFACCVKTSWDVDPSLLLQAAEQIGFEVRQELLRQGIDDNDIFTPHNDLPLRDLPPEVKRLLIQNSISPLPLHKSLTLLDVLRQHAGQPYYAHALLAFGTVLVGSISNLRFGPEVGVGKLKQDVPVVRCWLAQVERMAADLASIRDQDYLPAEVHLADARNPAAVLAPASVDAVITSPPYPNEKDYTRTTRLESVLLGFYDTKSELRGFKHNLLRSNTRGIYKADADDTWVASNQEVQRLAEAIEARRIELGKTSGFEKLYARATRLYFGGMARHLAELSKLLRPGAQLAYVVGDQASYLRVMIRTGELLAGIAADLGYEVVGIDLFRTRYATATQADLREEVVVLRWPGN
jgi:SAM-dependent methyltransferase